MAVIYDGLFLIALLIFEEYPLDKFSLLATVLNPIDLTRIMILLKLDISALLGYTGAIFRQFFGSNVGFLLSLVILILWVIAPFTKMMHSLKNKDF